MKPEGEGEEVEEAEQKEGEAGEGDVSREQTQVRVFFIDFYICFPLVKIIQKINKSYTII